MNNNIIIRFTIAIGCIVALTNAEPTCTPQFNCVDVHTYQIHGYNQACPAGSICNSDYSSECKPCVELNEVTCQFKCNGNTAELSISDAKAVAAIPCGTGKVCNAGYLNGCLPCIDETCPVKYTCNPANPSQVSVGGLTFNCLDGKHCNSEYKYPCDYCISKIPGAYPSYPPNCNDGFGLTNQCRPGPRGSNFYYKCQKISKHYFDYEIKKCLWQGLDFGCKRNRNICN